MPTLRCFFAIYTDGSSPVGTFDPPPGTEVFLGEMTELVVPGPADELFGPHAPLFTRFHPTRGFLLGISREVPGRAGTFFDDARRVLLAASQGLTGVGLDVLRLWPFPLKGVEDALPDELLAEDLFSVGFTEMGVHGFRAETFGFAKLGQRELSFEFTGRELIEEAALMCGHLADWLLDHGRRLESGDAMAFGFDRIGFAAAEGQIGPFRGWHPALIQKLLPEALFPGVGVLEVQAWPDVSSARADVSIPLQRSLDQRLLLEELDLTGDSPHATATARVSGSVTSLHDLRMWREESIDAKDSGWRFSAGRQDGPKQAVLSLAQVVERVPALIRYLALPFGVRLAWTETGTLEVDLSKTRREVDAEADAEPDDGDD